MPPPRVPPPGSRRRSAPTRVRCGWFKRESCRRKTRTRRRPSWRRLRSPRSPRAVTVPVAALVPAAGGEGFQVFVVDSERVAHVRPVTVGGQSETVAEIAFGLQAGEVVVTNGAYGVADGAKILQAAPPPR